MGAGVLIAIDDTEASNRALRYVADMLAGQSGCRIVVLHLLGPYPPALREHGGAEDPEEEQRLGEELRQQRTRWKAQRCSTVQPLLESARAMLVDSGVDASRVGTVCGESTLGVAAECVATARREECGTIAVGRHTLPWYREMFRRHHGDDLLREAGDLTVWVVE